MEKKFLFLSICLVSVLTQGCKKDNTATPTPKLLTVTAKVLDAETDKPLENVIVHFRGYEIINLAIGLSNSVSARTNSKGEVSLSLEDFQNFDYNLSIYDQGLVEITAPNQIDASKYRNIQDLRNGPRVLNHTFHVTKGGTINLKFPSKAILGKDSIDIDFHQIKNGIKYRNFVYNNLALEYIGDPLHIYFQTGYLADLPIFVNYKYKSNNIWKRDTLLFSAGKYENYELKY